MGYTLIQTQTLASTATTVTFSSIPQSYTDLVLVSSARTAYAGGNGDTVTCQFNGDTTATNYTYRRLIGNGASASAASGNFFFAGYCNSSSDTASAYGNATLYLPNYSVTGTKVGTADSAFENNAVTGIPGIHANAWTGTAAITSIALSAPSAAAFSVGSSFSLYGIK